MKRKAAIGLLFFLLFTTGCVTEQTFEDFFHQKMEEMQEGKDYSYNLVYTKFNAVREDDAIAVFKEQNEQGEKIVIAYFEKQNKQWEWKHTRGAEWNSPVKWSAMNQPPYIYSGPISDNLITEVYAGEEQAEIIEIEAGKRFWYAVSPTQDAEVLYVKEDGTKETIEQVNHEEIPDK